MEKKHSGGPRRTWKSTSRPTPLPYQGCACGHSAAPTETLPEPCLAKKKGGVLRSHAGMPRVPQCAVGLGRKAQTARGKSPTLRITQLLSGTPHPFYQPPRDAPSLLSQPLRARFGIRDPSAPTSAPAASVASRRGLRTRGVRRGQGRESKVLLGHVDPSCR